MEEEQNSEELQNSEEVQNTAEEQNLEEESITEEVPKSTVKQIAIKYGMILGLVSIIWFLFMNFMDVIGKSGPLQWLGLLFTIIVIYMAHKAFKNEGDGYMSYGQGLGIGTLIALISGIIANLFNYVYVTFVDDLMIRNIKEQQLLDMEERGMSDAQIEQAMELAGRFSSPEFLVIFGILGAVLIGFIISLIVSAITKNQSPEPQY